MSDVNIVVEQKSSQMMNQPIILLRIFIHSHSRVKFLIRFTALNAYITFTKNSDEGSITRLLAFCFRNLLGRKVRTALCVLGVILAITFVITVGATTMRYTAVIKEMNILFSGEIMVVSREAIVIQAIPIGGGLLPMNYTVAELEETEGVDKVVPVLFVTPLGIGSTIQPVPVNFSMGIPVQQWELVLGPTPLKGEVGRFPENETSIEVVVGVSLADQYSWNVGDYITINNHLLEVTGILDTKLALLSRCIVMPLRLAQQIYNYHGSVNIVAVRPRTGFLPSAVASDIEQKMGHVKALTEDERNDVVQPILTQVETWNLGIQSVVFLMSLILVMTVTVMNVSERRRDFATLDAIGAPLNYIFSVVIVESALIGVLGGLLGLFFGSISAIAVASVYTSIPLPQFIPSIFEIVPPVYMIEILCATVIVCCTGGLIPAFHATRIRISEVLKAEY